MNNIETVASIVRTCYLCGGKSQEICAGIKQCKICRRNVCWGCSEHIDIECDLKEPCFNSDYPEYICKPCWEKGKEIRGKIMEVREEAGEREYGLWGEWRECVNEKKNK